MTSDALNSFSPVEKSKPLYTNTRSLALNRRGDSALVGGMDGKLGVYSISEKAIVREMDAGPGAVTDVLWLGDRMVASTSAGNVKIYENEAEVSSFSCHAGEVMALAVHPSGDILASVGVDKSYVFYDLTSSTVGTQVLTDAGKNAQCYIRSFITILTILSSHYCWLPSRWPSFRCWGGRRPDQGVRCEKFDQRSKFRIHWADNGHFIFRERHMAGNGGERLYRCVNLGSPQSYHCPHYRCHKSNISCTMGVQRTIPCNRGTEWAGSATVLQNHQGMVGAFEDCCSICNGSMGPRRSDNILSGCGRIHYHFDGKMKNPQEIEGTVFSFSIVGYRIAANAG